MARLNIALLSSTQFGRHCLEEGILPVDEVRVAGVITTPRVIDISYSDEPVEICTHARFDDPARREGFEIIELSGRIGAEDYLGPLKRWRPDVVLALGWYYLVPRAVRDRIPKGCLGIHASLLPKYRGNAPIPWAIINGEKETGVTLFYLVNDVDAGDVVAQRAFPIDSDDTVDSVYRKAKDASASVLRETLPLIARNAHVRVPQDEAEATYYPKRSPEDGEIDWSWDAKRIRDFIRAQTKPYPGAFTYIQGKKVVIWDADIIDAPQRDSAG